MPTESLRTLMLASLVALALALMSSCADVCTRHSDCAPGLECSSAGICLAHVPELPADGGETGDAAAADAAAADAAAPDAAAPDAGLVAPDDGEISPLPLSLHPRDHRRSR